MKREYGAMELLLIQAQLSLSGGDSGEGTGSGSGYGVLLVLLVLLAGGVAALFWLSRRGFPVRRQSSGELKIREMKPLGGRQFLVVGEYGKARFLLGVCPGKIDYLCPLDSGEEASFDEHLPGDPPLSSGCDEIRKEK